MAEKKKQSEVHSNAKTSGFVYACLFLFLVLNAILCLGMYIMYQKVESAKNVYVYSSDTLAKQYPELVALKQKYDADLQALTQQVGDVRAKLSAMKDKKTQAEASEAYLESLVEKRNNLP